jgi:methionine biosynthesis protein MetW
VVLSRTLQSVHNPRDVLDQLLRIGRRAIVSFDNFGYWRTRWTLMSTGRNPIYGEGDRWWHSDIVHPFTISDFLDLCAALDIRIEQTLMLDGAGRVTRSAKAGRRANLLAKEAVFVLSRR